MTAFSFEVSPRCESLGSGWRVSLFEDGEEVGGGVFEAGDDGYSAAYDFGAEWVGSYQ